METGVRPQRNWWWTSRLRGSWRNSLSLWRYGCWQPAAARLSPLCCLHPSVTISADSRLVVAPDCHSPSEHSSINPSSSLLSLCWLVLLLFPLPVSPSLLPPHLRLIWGETKSVPLQTQSKEQNLCPAKFEGITKERAGQRETKCKHFKTPRQEDGQGLLWAVFLIVVEKC